MLCQMCGHYGQHNTHHRINKGGGGSALFDRASLLIKACGSGTTGCHGRVTQNPAWAESIGWLLPRNNPDIDPEQERIHTIHGWVLLTDAGERIVQRYKQLGNSVAVPVFEWVGRRLVAVDSALEVV